MAVTNPAAIRFAVPQYSIDQIIDIFSGTISLGAPSASPGYTTGSSSPVHTFGDSCYFQGIFSTDSGTTWNDFGAQIPNTSGGLLQVQTVDVEMYTDSSTAVIQAVNWYDVAHSSGTAHTVLYKVYLIAKNTMALTVTPVATNQIITYSSAFNFQKVFLKGTTSISVAAGASGSSAPVTHSLGYIPKVRSFFIDGTSRVFALNQWKPLVAAGVPQSVVAIETHITSTTLTFTSDQGGFGGGVSGNIDYRIYLDS